MEEHETVVNIEIKFIIIIGNHINKWKEGIRDQFEQTLAVLRENLGRFPEAVGLQARQVLDEAPGLLEQIEELPALEPVSTRIRCHGDYHLGQVLRTDDDFVILKTEHGTLAFQKVEDPTPGKNRLHLDLEAGAGERQAEVDRLVGLGASVSARHDEGEGFGWVTLADPQGNLFDIAGASADGS